MAYDENSVVTYLTSLETPEALNVKKVSNHLILVAKH